MIYIIGGYILFTICYSIINKNNTFDSFKKGIKDGLNIVINMFQILLSFTFCITCLLNCGLIESITNKFNSGFIIILIQMIIRPLSNSSSYTILLNIYDKHGVDSYLGILSSLIHSSCDTIFYILSIYSSYAKVKFNNKYLIYGILVILFTYCLIICLCTIFYY